jgi:hypothetical protein
VRILFDQGTPAPMRHLLAGHVVTTANELGWSALKNGELLAAAEGEGFELFVTTDTNLKYQQKPLRAKNWHRCARHGELAAHQGLQRCWLSEQLTLPDPAPVWKSPFLEGRRDRRPTRTDGQHAFEVSL